MQSFNDFVAFAAKIAGLAVSLQWLALRFFYDDLPPAVQEHLFAIAGGLSFLVFSADHFYFYPKFRSPLRHLPEINTTSAMSLVTETPRGGSPLRWMQQYPDADLLVVRTLIKSTIVYPVSPSALRDVMSTNTYDFEKPWGLRAFLARVIGFGLITSEGDPHKHQRKALTPAFNIKNIRALYPAMWEQTGILLAGMEKDMKGNGQIDIGQWASRLALDIIGRSALSRDFNSLTTEEHRIAKAFFTILEPEPHMVVYFGLNLLFPQALVCYLPLKANRIVKAESDYLRSVCEEILDEKQAEMAALAAGEKKSAAAAVAGSDILQKILDTGEFARDELVDQMLTFVAAGHETTGSSISWATHLLTLPEYKHYQAILRDEIRAAIPSPNFASASAADAPTHTTFESLPYLNGVCEEILRLFPAVPSTLRESVRATSIGGVPIPKGTLVVLSPWSINRNPRFWGPDAGALRPERWIDALPGGERRANRHGGAESNYCELTFLHGQRACIGRDFAKAELRCVLAAIFGRFELSRLPGDNGDVVISGAVTTKPRDGLRVQLKVVDGWCEELSDSHKPQSNGSLAGRPVGLFGRARTYPAISDLGLVIDRRGRNPAMAILRGRAAESCTRRRRGHIPFRLVPYLHPACQQLRAYPIKCSPDSKGCPRSCDHAQAPFAIRPQMAGKPPRSRTFTGCGTCRARHVKCDQARPTCNACRRLGITCQGYGARLLWVADDDAVRSDGHGSSQRTHEATTYRQILFTEEDRRLMSIELVKSSGGRTANKMITNLEAECDGLVDDMEDGFVAVGPFGAFKAVSASSPPSSSASSERVGSLDDAVEEIPREPCDIQRLLSPHHEDPLVAQPHSDIAGGDIDEFLNELSADPHDFDLFMPQFSPGQNSFSLDASSPSLLCDSSIGALKDQLTDHMPIPQDFPSAGEHPNFSQVDVSFLLRYYKDNVIARPSSLQSKRKSPWQILLLPCAMETFAEITLWNTASHTRSTIFYAILANSAFHLYNFHPQQHDKSHWHGSGVRYQQTAMEHLKRALQTELLGPGKAKYKELLMAVLTMAMASVFNGIQNIRMFLLDAERLIRLRGIPKQKKSFKARLLHHMYTHLRIISESTFVCSGPCDEQHLSLRQLQLGTASAATLRQFRISEDCLNADMDPSQDKGMELGYNDIHLEVQGQWSETLYPDIYGIPESLMTLLSQTISLGNEKERLNRIALNNAEVSSALSCHIKTLEQSIWSWHFPSMVGPTRPETLEAPESTCLDQPVARCMVLAMHQALLIYFYRRIYNISAMILQEYVRKTLDYLLPCVAESVEDQDFASSIAWPAFIAACEAVEPDLQEKGLQCLSIVDRRGVFFASKEASEIVREIWKRRKDCGDLTISWPTVMQQVS